MEAVIIVRGCPPYSQYYRVYATGNEDPDIFIEHMKMQFAKYSIIAPAVIQQIPCKDSRVVLAAYIGLLQGWHMPNGAHPPHGINEWRNIRIDFVRGLIHQAINNTMLTL